MKSTQNNQTLIIRDALPQDMNCVQAIYSYEVLHGLASFEEIPPDIEQMKIRLNEVSEQGLPYLIASFDGEIAGFCYASRYRARPAYRNSIEDSVYVAQQHRGKKIGHALLNQLIKQCELAQMRQMIAVIGDSKNIGSIKLHQQLGFHHVGTLKAVGFKFGQWVDSVIMQRPIGSGDLCLPSSSKNTQNKS